MLDGWGNWKEVDKKKNEKGENPSVVLSRLNKGVY